MNKYDLVIVGGGPAGVAAGIYAARKKMKAMLIAQEFGGQSLTSADVQNWIGTKSVSGYDLGVMLESHLRAQEGIEIVSGEWIDSIERAGEGFVLKAQSGKTFETKNLLLASGSRRKKLGVPGEKEFDGKGVVYCSTCDAPLFKNKDVVVVGGGNAGLEAVIDLFPYAAKIYLIIRSEGMKGDVVSQEKIKADSRVTIITQADTLEVLGDKFVTGFKYKDRPSGEVKELKVSGVFVEVGAVPNSEFVKSLVTLNEKGEVIVDHKTQMSSDPHIWAVGDVSDVLYKQNNISAGDAVKAVLNIYDHLKKQ